MIHYYLAKVVGNGKDLDNAFRPAGVDPIPLWGAIDLRPRASDVGYMLVGQSDRREGPNREYLGDHEDTVSAAVKKLLQSRLGVTLNGPPQLSVLLQELLEEDVMRRGRLLPTECGTQDVWLAGRLIARRAVGRPVLRPNTLTDNFDRADENPIAGNWGTFGGTLVQLKIVSNHLVAVSAGVNAASVYTGSGWNANQSAKVDWTDGTSSIGGGAVRCDGSGSGYIGTARQGGSALTRIHRVDSSSLTQLSTDSTNTDTSPYAVKLDIAGSSLTLTRNVTTRGTATDSTYATGKAGAFIVIIGAETAFADNWAGTGDAVAAAFRRNAGLDGLGASGGFFRDPLVGV